MLNPSSLCRKTTVRGLASLNGLYAKGPAFGGSILWHAFELTPTLLCWCTGTATIFLWRNIAEILPEKDIMRAEHHKPLGCSMFVLVDPAFYWLC